MCVLSCLGRRGQHDAAVPPAASSNTGMDDRQWHGRVSWIGACGRRRASYILARCHRVTRRIRSNGRQRKGEVSIMTDTDVGAGGSRAHTANGWDRTGVRYLDDILGGGLPRGSLVLIMGLPGSGKTTIASQIAFTAARSGKRVLILTALSEPTNKLIAHLGA